MVTLLVDEAAAYDALSIVYVKQERLGRDLHEERERILSMLIAILGRDRHCRTLNSPEFHRLLQCNSEVFELVDKAARDEVKASTVVEANLRRYSAKRDLQFVHFDRHLEEIKI